MHRHGKVNISSSCYPDRHGVLKYVLFDQSIGNLSIWSELILCDLLLMHIIPIEFKDSRK